MRPENLDGSIMERYWHGVGLPLIFLLFFIVRLSVLHPGLWGMDLHH